MVKKKYSILVRVGGIAIAIFLIFITNQVAYFLGIKNPSELGLAIVGIIALISYFIEKNKKKQK